MNPKKLLIRLTASQTNVRFGDLLRLVRALGFELDHISGSHQMFVHSLYNEAQLNLQPDGAQAKPYQIRQLMRLVEEYNLTLE